MNKPSDQVHDPAAAPRVSVVIPARDEQHNIAGCIASLRGFASEVIVVDDGSSDDTAQVAQGLGARVIRYRRGDQPVESLVRVGFEAASGQWLLMIDADERMTPGLAQALLTAARDTRWSAVRFARLNMLFGGPLMHGGWFRAEHQRFVRADRWDRAWACEIHGPIPVHGHVLTLPAERALATVHHDYDNVPQFIQRTLLGYAKTEAHQRVASGEPFSVAQMLYKPVRRTLGRFIFRRGYRDGLRGWVVAVLLGAYALCIEINKWDLYRQQAVSDARPTGGRRQAPPAVLHTIQSDGGLPASVRRAA